MSHPMPDTDAHRREVFEFVHQAARENAQFRGVRAWRLYHRFKDQLSKRCGRNAPPTKRDEQLFSDAVAEYVKGVRL